MAGKRGRSLTVSRPGSSKRSRQPRHVGFSTEIVRGVVLREMVVGVRNQAAAAERSLGQIAARGGREVPETWFQKRGWAPNHTMTSKAEFTAAIEQLSASIGALQHAGHLGVGRFLGSQGIDDMLRAVDQLKLKTFDQRTAEDLGSAAKEGHQIAHLTATYANLAVKEANHVNVGHDIPTSGIL